MAVIRVDFDELMQFGHTYAVMSDSLEKHARVLELDLSGLDQTVRAFGVQLSIPNDHFAGMNLTQATADGLARSRRVADYLNNTSSSLYRHAGAVNAQDDHFDWLGLVANTSLVGYAIVSLHPYVDETAAAGLVLLADEAFGEFITSTFGLSTIGAVLGPLAVPVMLIAMGGATLYANALEFADGGDFWDQTADALGILSGGVAVIAGVASIVAAAVFGVAAIPYVVGVGGVVSLAAAVGSWVIDSRSSEIWEAISDAGSDTADYLNELGARIWNFGRVGLSTVSRLPSLYAEFPPTSLVQTPSTVPADAGADVADTLLEGYGAVDDIDFIKRFGGTPLSDVGALDRLGGTGFGPLSVLSAGRSAVAVPGTVEGIGDSWQAGDALGVARDLGELVDHGGTMASLVAPGYGTVVAMGAKSFVTGLDTGDWIDKRTGFSDFAADSIYDVFYAGASQ